MTYAKKGKVIFPDGGRKSINWEGSKTHRGRWISTETAGNYKLLFVDLIQNYMS
jgi:hypothetical protein